MEILITENSDLNVKTVVVKKIKNSKYKQLPLQNYATVDSAARM